MLYLDLSSQAPESGHMKLYHLSRAFKRDRGLYPSVCVSFLLSFFPPRLPFFLTANTDALGSVPLLPQPPEHLVSGLMPHALLIQAA